MNADNPPPIKELSPPPAIVRKVAESKPIAYATLYARVMAGERVLVANGVPAGAGVVACKIPGEPKGTYECWLETRQVCEGGTCRIVKSPQMKPVTIPQVMPPGVTK